MPSGHRLTKEQIRYIREHFSDTPNKVLAADLGISVSSVNNIQNRYRLTKSPEHSKKMHRLSGEASANLGRKIELTPETIRKRVESRHKTYLSERARVRLGLEQKTKIRIGRYERRKVKQNYYLRSRGYIIDESTLTAYYTPQTRRATRLESLQRGTKKGNIKTYYDFKELIQKNDYGTNQSENHQPLA